MAWNNKLVSAIIAMAVFALVVGLVPAQAFAGQDSIDQSRHKMTYIAAKPATCYDDGYVEHWRCVYCGQLFYDEAGKRPINDGGWHIKAHHEFTAHQAQPATCVAAGNSAYWECSQCGRCFSDAGGANEIAPNSWVIPATGLHDLIEHPEVVATCVAEGNSAYWECSQCGRCFSDAGGANEIAKGSWVVPAAGHDLTVHLAQAATYDSVGNSLYWECLTCGTCFSDEKAKTEIPAGSWIIPASKDNYKAVSSPDRAWEKGADEALTFTFKRAIGDGETFDRFVGVEVDGQAVPEKDASGKVNWTAKKGSLILSLEPAFLEALSGGGHVVKALFDDGFMEAAFDVGAQLVPAPTPASASEPASTATAKNDASQVGRAAVADADTSIFEADAGDSAVSDLEPIVDVETPTAGAIVNIKELSTNTLLYIDVIVAAGILCLLLSIFSVRSRSERARAGKRPRA